MALSRSLFLLAIAICFSQALAQYEPNCKPTFMYYLKATTSPIVPLVEKQLLDTMASTPNFAWLDVADTEDVWYTGSEYSSGMSAFSVDNINWIAGDIPTREQITKGTRILLVVVINTDSNLESWDSGQALIAAANRLKEVHNVEIFLLDLFVSTPVEYNFRLAQDIASNPVHEHVIYAQNSNVGFSYMLGVTSTAFASFGDPYIRTLDGNIYNFQGLGEYTLYRGFDYIAQVRMAPCDNSNPSSRTCNRAIALQSLASQNVVELHYDPVAQLVTVYQDGILVTPDVQTNAVYYNLPVFYIYISKYDTPIDSDSIFLVSINTNTDTTFNVAFGAKVGLAFYGSLDLNNFGRVQGLVGTWDGCATNDFYSHNQTYTSPSASPRDIYFNFADTWRVSEAESIFTHGVNAKYYMPYYDEYSPHWNPAFTGVEPSANAAGDCAFFKDIAPLLYSACVDDVSKGNGDIRPVAYLLTGIACSDYCYNEYSFGFVSDSYCASTCGTSNDLDFHGNYTTLNSDTFSIATSSVGATFSATLGGTYTYSLTSDFCPNAAVTGTVQITCGQPPQVSAGDDRVVKKHPVYNWPAVVLMGSVTGDDVKNLEYSWKALSAPMASNYTPGSFPTKLPTSPALPYIENPQSLTPVIWLEYPGDYVLELSVFDGCFITKDTVTIHAACEACQLHVKSSQIADQTFQSTGADSDGWVTSNAYSNVFIFDYTFAGFVEYHWFIDSNSRGYNFTYPEDTSSSTDMYTFTVTPTEQLAYRNLSSIVEYSNNSTNSSSSINTATILRYEGRAHYKTDYFTTKNTTTTIEHFTSVPIPITMCEIQIGSANSINPSFTIFADRNANISRPFTQTPACVGDYTVRVAARDECQTAFDLTNLHIGCSEQPQAHLISCPKTVQFDYGSRQFPSIPLNGRDTFDPDTPPANLVYQWEVVTPTGQTYFLTDCSGSPDENTYAYADCTTPNFQPDDGAGIYTVTMWVSDGCTYDFESTKVVTQCDPLTVSAAGENVNQDTVAPAFATVNLTAQFTTDHPAAVEELWTLVSAPQGYNQLPAQPAANMFSTNATTGVYLGGTYTYMYEAYDGCTTAARNVSFTYTCSNSMSFTLATDLPTQQFSAGGSFQPVTFTVNLNETVNINSSRVQYKASLVAQPDGSSSIILNDNQWLSFNGGANPTISLVPSVPGTYTIQVYVWDNCNIATQNISVTATCTAQVPTINGVQPSYVVPSFGSAIIDLAISDSFANYSMTWAITNAANQTSVLYLNSFGRTNVTFSVPAGVYTVTVAAATGAAGCVALSAPVTIQANCNFTLGVNTQQTITSAMLHGKFSRVTVSPTFSGVDPSNAPVDALNIYSWRFLSAPYGSVFAPFSSTVTTVTNHTTVGDYEYDGYEWTRTTTQVVVQTTEVMTKYVTLENYVDTFDKFDGCFAPDVDGTYVLQFSIQDYCGATVTQTFTVTAACNSAPTANAGSAATYTFDGTGFANNGYRFTTIPLNGSAVDLDGDFLDYDWTVISQPNNGTGFIQINNPHSRKASFVPTASGTYILQLSATDGCSTANSTVAITVNCPNTYQVNAPITFISDGYTPVSLQEFSLLANPQCTRSWNWEVTHYDPSTAIPPAPTTTESPKSGASQIAIPAFLIAFLTLFVRMF